MITDFKPHPWVERVDVVYLNDSHALIEVTLTEDGKYAQPSIAEECGGSVAVGLPKERHFVAAYHPEELVILTSRPAIEVASEGSRYTIRLLLRWADMVVTMRRAPSVSVERKDVEG